LHSRFTQANKTLGALAGGKTRPRWSDRVRIVPAHVVLKAPQIAPKIVQALQKALLNDIPVEGWYQSLRESAPTRRVLYPRGLVLRGSSLYLIAHQKDAGEAPYHYAVQRFSAVRLRELEFWPSMPFSLTAFMVDGKDQFGEGTSVRLKATISPELYKILRDSPLSEDMQVADMDGALTLSATVRDTWALHRWILGHGENICVFQPLALRKALAERLKGAASQYA
jgi:predicted DNA-binding transcriptional regulator YafY